MRWLLCGYRRARRAVCTLRDLQTSAPLFTRVAVDLRGTASSEHARDIRSDQLIWCCAYEHTQALLRAVGAVASAA
jgi:hypothetical protein